MHKTLYFRHGRATARLVPLSDDLWVLSNLWSYDRQKGHASALMEQVISHADQSGVAIKLKVQQYGKGIGLDNSQLETFYARFGFRREPGHGREVIMFRLPSQELHAS